MTDAASLARADAEQYGDEFTNCCASLVHFLGSRLTRPTTWLLLTGAKLIAKLTPGQRGQCNSCLLEIIMRIYYVIKMIILLPFVIALSSVGSILRVLAGYWRKELIFYAGNASGAFTSLAPETEQLRITTFNTALMPDFVTCYNGLRAPLRRVRELAVAVRHTGDQIVCLQEVFHPHAGRELCVLLKDMYPYIVYNVGFQSWGLDSGLVLLSKYPLSNPRYLVHPVLDGADKWARKGVLMATVHLGGGRRIVVTTTHLNGGGPNSVATRRHQIAHVTKSVRAYIHDANHNTPTQGGVTHQPIAAAFICGDFNIGPMTKEGLPDKEWASHTDFFTRYNHHYITPIQRLQGTTFDFDILGVGWAMRQLDQWKLTHERVDQILCHVGGALTPAQAAGKDAAANGTIGTNGAATNGSVAVNVNAAGSQTLQLQVPYGELRLDRMHGCSDHAAVRGSFTWGRPAIPLEGDGQPSQPVVPQQPVISSQPTAKVVGVDIYGNPIIHTTEAAAPMTLPGVNIGYGADGSFAPPAAVTIHS